MQRMQCLRIVGQARVNKISSTETGEEQLSAEEDRNVGKSKFFHQDQAIVAICNGGLAIWDLDSGAVDFPFAAHQPSVSTHVEDFVTSEDETLLVTAADDKRIRIWHLPTRRLLGTLVSEETWIPFVAISPDKKSVVAGGRETLEFWDIATLAEPRTATEGE